ncbi:MAG: GNAT family N-acetyltransferase [Chloroflexi bacterium]|nr:GNAT family N-acetyltransferase [Chloroflexota bacterium]
MDNQALTVRPAAAGDWPELARMNRRLIEDEGSENAMSIAELQARMEDWHARREYAIDVIGLGQALAGYAVWRAQSDEYRPGRSRVYVRQFFVERALRGRGIGRRAFERLAVERLPAGCLITLDVLATNPGGLRFWQSLGFDTYLTSMRTLNGAREPGRDSV